MDSVHRSILSGALISGALSLAFVMMGTPRVHAATVIGAAGADGANCPDFANPNERGCIGGNAGDGESVSASGNPALAIGGNGGVVGLSDAFDDNGNGGAGGSATAFAMGSSGIANVTVSASAEGGSGSPNSELGGAGRERRCSKHGDLTRFRGCFIVRERNGREPWRVR
jgi:hypothetical protein